jgi:hypothetical protein
MSPSNITGYILEVSSISVLITSNSNSSLGVFYTTYLYLTKKLCYPEVRPYTPKPATIMDLLGLQEIASHDVYE